MPVLNFPDAPLLSERLLLREIRHADLQPLYAVHSVEAVNRYLPYTTWQSAADGEAWWQRVTARMDEGTALQFAICRRDPELVIGSCVLFDYDHEHARIELGYALGQAHWGQGYALESMGRLLDFCFKELRLRRIEARVDSRNNASAALLARLGFSREGCLRAWQMEGTTPVDSLQFGLLSAEWAAPTH